ncbi:MAG: GTPase [Frankiaceae bacterium]|nr:GTPase [Frankiaceae bacterium]
MTEIDAAISGSMDVTLPILAVVGRPNVGKSTLVNRILGRREAVVEDVPGVTRDRVAYEAFWAGRRFILVDTGGWEPDATGLAARVAHQAELAVETADAVLLVVDATVGATDTDEIVAGILRRNKKSVILAANKVDDERAEADATMLWSLGLGEPFAVSALHGRGSGELLDAILAALPEAPPERTDVEDGPRRVALVGRPNVGKSSLFNRLLGEDRVVVDSVAGTTRDPVDTLLDLGGETWRFVDTAGLRRRVHQSRGAEYYSSLRTAGALEQAEVAVVLLDASEPLTDQDQRVVGMVEEAGRALVIVLNKWDLLDEDRRYTLERELDRDFARVAWAPRVNISALTGRSVDKLADALRVSLQGWDSRVSTGRLNAWLTEVVQGTPPPIRGGKAVKVLFATQASTRPPRFVIFTTGFLEPSYRRFLERRLREDFGFAGTPIEISIRIREKRQREK